MKKIEIGEKAYIFLDHRKLINDAYIQNGTEKHKLRAELFAFHPKESKIPKSTEKTSRKRRRKTESQQASSIPVDNTHLTDLTNVFKAVAELIPTDVCLKPMPRVWEQYSASDFPKFKGANTTTSFQHIDGLIEDACFLVPPASRFYNYDVSELDTFKDELNAPFDIIVLDPPWRNKYIRRLKRYQLGYSMLESKQLLDMPIGKLIHECSIVAIWCTNSKQHQEALLQQLLPAWQLRLLHTVKWLKLNTQGEPISPINSAVDDNGKQPFELLYITCHRDATQDFGANLKEVEMLLSIPSIIHSHKPPLLDWLRTYFSLWERPKCLELFARYLQPYFTSFGLEVVKLMDKRLYENCEGVSLEGS